VEVARDAPVSGHEEQAGTRLSVGRPVLGTDHFRFATPYRALSVRAPDLELLPVGVVVDGTAEEAKAEDCKGVDWSELDRMVDEVQTDRGVESGDVAQTAPADVEPGPVEHDVDRTHVARLPPEEFGEVDQMQSGRDPRAVDEPVQLVVLQERGQVYM